MTNVDHVESPPAPPLVESDPDTIVTPSAKRRAVLAALRERATLGDALARGAVEVIEALEARANGLAWEGVR